ncbi:MAG: hypothetical protein ACLQVL_13460 [Terriglobia bacterium]
MMPSLCAAFSPRRRLLENFGHFGDGKWAPPLEGLAERFAFQKLHGDVGRAVVGLARFVNGDDIRVMDAAGGSRKGSDK